MGGLSGGRFLLFLTLLQAAVHGAYRGKLIGDLKELEHQVKGKVYAVDSRTIHISGFSYDGQAPDAFFYAGTTSTPSEQGFIIPDEKGTKNVLGRYRTQDLTLTLPDGKTLKDIKWISVWCKAFSVDFGHINIPRNFDYPKPQKIAALTTNEHDVSSDRIVVVDAQTFLIPNFSYDGSAPDAHFWVGKGSGPDANGNIVPDENGSEEPLKKYSRKTIVITLPGSQTVFDIDYLSIWCRAFTANFGMVTLPNNLNVPPSLNMLGIAPQSKHPYPHKTKSSSPSSYSNSKKSYNTPQISKSSYDTPQNSKSSYDTPQKTQKTYAGWPTVSKSSNTKAKGWPPAKSSATTPAPFYRPTTPSNTYFKPASSSRKASSSLSSYRPTTTRKPYRQPTTQNSYWTNAPRTTTPRPYRPTTQRTYRPPTTERQYRPTTAAPKNNRQLSSNRAHKTQNSFFNIPRRTYTTEAPEREIDNSRSNYPTSAPRQYWQPTPDSRENDDDSVEKRNPWSNPFTQRKQKTERRPSSTYSKGDSREKDDSSERKNAWPNPFTNRKDHTERPTTRRPFKSSSFTYPNDSEESHDSREESIFGSHRASSARKSSSSNGSKKEMESYSTFTMNVGGKRSSYSIFQ